MPVRHRNPEKHIMKNFRQAEIIKYFSLVTFTYSSKVNKKMPLTENSEAEYDLITEKLENINYQ